MTTRTTEVLHLRSCSSKAFRASCLSGKKLHFWIEVANCSQRVVRVTLLQIVKGCEHQQARAAFRMPCDRWKWCVQFCLQGTVMGPDLSLSCPMFPADKMLPSLLIIGRHHRVCQHMACQRFLKEPQQPKCSPFPVILNTGWLEQIISFSCFEVRFWNQKTNWFFIMEEKGMNCPCSLDMFLVFTYSLKEMLLSNNPHFKQPQKLNIPVFFPCSFSRALPVISNVTVYHFSWLLSKTFYSLMSKVTHN